MNNLELISYIACATLGFSISQMLTEFVEMRRIRKAVERFANDFHQTIKERE